MGVSRIRLTGGEPLLREDILDIVRGIKQLGVIRDLSVTTNGSLLNNMARPLKEAGLDRLNVSLDSLDSNRFQAITASYTYKNVREGILRALEESLPVKLNMVVLRDLSEKEIIEFVRLAQYFPIQVRFLEFMPLCGTNWQVDQFVPIKEIRRIVERNFSLFPMPADSDAVASLYSLANGKGSVGFIASVTESFCNRCSRIRLSSDGKIFPCLFSTAQVSVKDLLRCGASDEEISGAIQAAVRLKPAGNAFKEGFTGAEQSEMYKRNGASLIRSIGG